MYLKFIAWGLSYTLHTLLEKAFFRWTHSQPTKTTTRIDGCAHPPYKRMEFRRASATDEKYIYIYIIHVTISSAVAGCSTGRCRRRGCGWEWATRNESQLGSEGSVNEREDRRTKTNENKRTETNEDRRTH